MRDGETERERERKLATLNTILREYSSNSCKQLGSTSRGTITPENKFHFRRRWKSSFIALSLRRYVLCLLLRIGRRDFSSWKLRGKSRGQWNLQWPFFNKFQSRNEPICFLSFFPLWDGDEWRYIIICIIFAQAVSIDFEFYSCKLEIETFHIFARKSLSTANGSNALSYIAPRSGNVYLEFQNFSSSIPL